MFLTWDVRTILFTSSELFKLHKHFFHPSSRKLFNLLRRVFPKNCPPHIRSRIEELTRNCGTCQRRSHQIHRFRVSIPEENVVFNFEAALDLMFLDIGKNRKAQILHLVDTQTDFQNAVFLKGESARDVSGRIH